MNSQKMPFTFKFLILWCLLFVRFLLLKPRRNLYIVEWEKWTKRRKLKISTLCCEYGRIIRRNYALGHISFLGHSLIFLNNRYLDWKRCTVKFMKFQFVRKPSWRFSFEMSARIIEIALFDKCRSNFHMHSWNNWGVDQGIKFTKKFFQICYNFIKIWFICIITK